MKEQLKTTPPFVAGIWVTGTLVKTKEEFVGRTCKFTDGQIRVILATRLGDFKNFTLEYVESYKELSINFSITHSELEFIKGMWVIGAFGVNWFIGVTCIRTKRNSIALVTHSCETYLIPFDKGRNLKELFISDQDTPHSITRSNYKKTNIFTGDFIAEIILNSINNQN